MFFDSEGFPRMNGADDFADSFHLAGLLAMFNHPQAVDMTKYVIITENNDVKYKRHPGEDRYDMSRDNATIGMTGLWKQGKASLVDLDYIDGKDVMPPSIHGMVRIMKGGEPHFWERGDFEAEFQTNITIQKLEEPFQVIAGCMVYGDGFLDRWTRENNLWRWAIRRYLSQLDGGWRKEPELAEFFISQIESGAVK